MTTGLRIAVGIPTRNRADLAHHAIRSVVEQLLPATLAVELFVSDNSTAPRETAALEQRVSSIGDSRIVRLRPPGDLPMVEHWNFLLTQMLERSDADYFLFLTDRMFFKRDALRTLGEALERHPHSPLLAYGIDTLHDLVPPFFLRLQKWSGRCVKIPAVEALDAVSRAHLHDYLPKMLNSAAHRGLIERLTGHYGSVFSSFAPDFAFCFRALSLIDHYTSLDQSLIVQHGLARSNGHSMSRGIATADSRDFMARLRPASRRVCDADSRTPDHRERGHARISPSLAPKRRNVSDSRRSTPLGTWSCNGAKCSRWKIPLRERLQSCYCDVTRNCGLRTRCASTRWRSLNALQARTAFASAARSLAASNGADCSSDCARSHAGGSTSRASAREASGHAAVLCSRS